MFLIGMKAVLGHSFSTYARRGEGIEQKRTTCVQWVVLTHLSTYATNSLFEFAVFCNICYDYFLSPKCFKVFFSKELLIGYFKTSELEMGEGVVKCVKVRTMGKGANCCHLGAYVPIE